MINQLPRHRAYNASANSRRRGNPYFSNRRTDNFGASTVKNVLAHISPRVWLWFLLLIILVAVLAWLFLFSNILVIKNIEVRGASIISSAEIESLARNDLAKNRLFLLSESRLAVFNSQALKQEIFSHYALDKVQITKKIPSTLIITINEKIPVAVWFEADTFSEIDGSGWILAQTFGNLEGLPTIYNNGSPKINDKKIEGADQEITFVKYLAPEFVSRFSTIKIKQLTVDDEQDTIKLVPERGGMIYFSSADDLARQLDRLDALLRSELKGRFEKVHYIDLRFGDKVYYK